MNTDNIKKIIEKNNGIITVTEVDKYGIDSLYLTDMVSLRDYANIFGISERIESILEVLDYEI